MKESTVHSVTESSLHLQNHDSYDLTALQLLQTSPFPISPLILSRLFEELLYKKTN